MNEKITDGIDITTWNVPVPGKKDSHISYSVWDFAGQTVYYNTHQVLCIVLFYIYMHFSGLLKSSPWCCLKQHLILCYTLKVNLIPIHQVGCVLESLGPSIYLSLHAIYLNFLQLSPLSVDIIVFIDIWLKYIRLVEEILVAAQYQLLVSMGLPYDRIYLAHAISCFICWLQFCVLFKCSFWIFVVRYCWR